MRKVLLALPAVAVAAAAIFTSSGQSVFAAPVSLTLRAGDGEPGYAVNRFLPETVYIRAGDTLTWEWDWPEPHSITFGEIQGNPEPPSHPDVAVVEHDGTEFVNSGLLFPTAEPASFSMKFNAEGTFDYYCFIHPFMTGEVVVQPEGVGEQDTQASIDARGQTVYNDSIAILKAAAAAAAADPVAVTAKAGGGRTHHLQVSSNNDIMVGDVQQFFPASINVGLNDAVEFTSNVHTPHDIAFIPAGVDLSGPPPPELADFDPFAPGGFNYSPGVKIDGTKFVASPIIGLEYPDGQKASFTFGKAGSYTYVCILHVEQGMMGTINVTAGAPGAPNTGDTLRLTPVEQSGASGLLLVAGAVAIAMGASTVAFAASRR
jgi:plastocyanin